VAGGASACAASGIEAVNGAAAALKPPSQAVQHVIAATFEVQGEHLVFLNAESKLAALFLMELIQSWNVLPAAISG
jgi:hypothetical protein